MPPKKDEAKELVVLPKGGALAAYDYGAESAAGFENTGKDDFTVPFVSKAHYICPQVDTGDAKYIPDCKPGDIFNTVTNELFKGSIAIVPVSTGHNFGEWVPKKNPGSTDPRDGGFVGIHGVSSPIVKAAKEAAFKKMGAKAQFGKLKTPDANTEGRYDNDLVETFYLFFVGARADGSAFKAGIRFASTQIKVYRNQVMTSAGEQRFKGPDGRQLGYPLFAHAFDLGTRPDQNKQGKFFSWRATFRGGSATTARLEPWAKIGRGEFVDPNDPALWSDLYALAKDFSLALNSGKAKVDFEAAARAEGGVADHADDQGGGSSPAAGMSEDLPY